MHLHKSIFTTEITHESSKVNKSWRDKWVKAPYVANEYR